MATSSDIIVIGAGIAGASVAAELSGHSKVTLLDMENVAGYHTTGRSAATFVPTYGPPVIRALTRASEEFFRSPPNGFCENVLIAPRGELMIAGPGNEQHIAQALKDGLQQISLGEAKQLIPPLKTDSVSAAVFEACAEDLDVDQLHQGFLKSFRRAGGTTVFGAEVQSLTRKDGYWRTTTSNGAFCAAIVVNAAGAWADQVAEIAGCRRLGVVPKRRSAALVPVPDSWDISQWPLTFGAGETFYFRPMGGQLMVSPADETPVEPHDAWADDLLIAEAIERLQDTIEIEVTHLEHTWGGLRTFAPDGDPIIGFDPRLEGFFWLAGQGGYGIQTSPAMARIASALIRGNDLPEDVVQAGVSDQALSPARFG